MFILNRFVLHTVNVPAVPNRNHASYTDNGIEMNSQEGAPECAAKTLFRAPLLQSYFLEAAKHYDISQVLPYNTSLCIKGNAWLPDNVTTIKPFNCCSSVSQVRVLKFKVKVDFILRI